MKKTLPKSDANVKLRLQLFVSGMSEKSMAAIANIKELCAKHLEERFELEIIDIYKNPQAARDNQVVFSPSLIKNFPLPKRILIGTFSDAEKVIRALDLTTL